MKHLVLTVGHSTHPIDEFVTLLQSHYATAVADVRSVPYSRLNPQFNQERLAATLEDHGIRYVFLGRELGARSKDPACYKDGQIQYSYLARTDLFLRGLDRVIQGALRYRIALMCAERDPIDCHRAILVARELANRQIDVAHILGDGRLEPHDETNERLLMRFGLCEPQLFSLRSELIEQAYEAQAARIAYVEKDAAGVLDTHL